MLQEFTKQTGTFKPYNYEFTEYDKLTNFAKSVSDVVNDSNGVVRIMDDDKMFYENFEDMRNMAVTWTTTLNSVKYVRLDDPLRKGFSALEMFKGMQQSKESWDASYQKYYA